MDIYSEWIGFADTCMRISKHELHVWAGQINTVYNYITLFIILNKLSKIQETFI